MSLFQPTPEPQNPLARYRVLSPSAGVRVSPLCLGAMSIGDKWEAMGAMDKASSFRLLDAFWSAGGNFIDTANNYQSETSELFIGEWAEQKGIRDQLVIATKYTSNYKMGNQDVLQVNYNGNNAKSMFVSLNDSLKKLRTSYVDILYVHWWDFDTGIEEVMRSLHSLVMAGKVLYLGASDMPAWVVSQANEFARQKGFTPFSIYQGRYSLLLRDMENEIYPMCRAHGMAIAPYGVLGSGKFFSDDEERRREESGEQGRRIRGPEWKRNEKERAISKTLETVANKIDIGDSKHPSLTSVALAHCMLKTPYVFPIIGGRKVEHLNDNIVSLDIIRKGLLTKEMMQELEKDAPRTQIFPNVLIGDGTSKDNQCFLLHTAGFQDRIEPVQAIGYVKH